MNSEFKITGISSNMNGSGSGKGYFSNWRSGGEDDGKKEEKHQEELYDTLELSPKSSEPKAQIDDTLWQRALKFLMTRLRIRV
ncbi:MAG: hypothetical protein SFU25_09295 [Candidatus Caenarcaniphilales bacterium]|nr:hypothetical protein [Candidatus Caenarcaniphilales bacterium]